MPQAGPEQRGVGRSGAGGHQRCGEQQHAGEHEHPGASEPVGEPAEQRAQRVHPGDVQADHEPDHGNGCSAVIHVDGRQRHQPDHDEVAEHDATDPEQCGR
jgi:hypothetical protein